MRRYAGFVVVGHQVRSQELASRCSKMSVVAAVSTRWVVELAVESARLSWDHQQIRHQRRHFRSCGGDRKIWFHLACCRAGQLVDDDASSCDGQGPACLGPASECGVESNLLRSVTCCPASAWLLTVETINIGTVVTSKVVPTGGRAGEEAVAAVRERLFEFSPLRVGALWS